MRVAPSDARTRQLKINEDSRTLVYSRRLFLCQIHLGIFAEWFNLKKLSNSTLTAIKKLSASKCWLHLTFALS